MKSNTINLILRITPVFISGMILISIMGCKKEQDETYVLPNVSGIYLCPTRTMEDSSKVSYIFNLIESADTLEKCHVTLIMVGKGGLSTISVLEGPLTCTRWDRSIPGQLRMEGTCDLGLPAGNTTIQGIFIAGITLGYQIQSGLVSDSGSVTRSAANGNPTEPPPVNQSYLGNYQFQLSAGTLQSVAPCYLDGCRCVLSFPWNQRPATVFYATVNQESYSNLENAYYINGTMTNEDWLVWYYDGAFFAIVQYGSSPWTLFIFEKSGYVNLDNCAYSACWMPGQTTSLNYKWFTPTYECCFYAGNLQIVPASK